MTEKKILLIEDQPSSIKSAFDIANALYFENKLTFTFVPRSQDVDYSRLKDDYDLVFVDITLAKRSEMNGYGIIKKLLSENLMAMDKILIMTGNSRIEENLKENGITTKLTIIKKPLTFVSLKPVLEQHLQ